MMAYDWPGNIRELKHVVITAAVMSEGRVIQAEQLGIAEKQKDANEGSDKIEATLFQEQDEASREKQGVSKNGGEGSQTALPTDLNPRQTLAWKYLRVHGSISNKDLLNLMDGGISKRTASYDIQDLVNRGLLVRVGKGPTTRYVRPAEVEHT